MNKTLDCERSLLIHYSDMPSPENIGKKNNDWSEAAVKIPCFMLGPSPPQTKLQDPLSKYILEENTKNICSIYYGASGKKTRQPRTEIQSGFGQFCTLN